MSKEQPTLHGYPIEIGDKVWSIRYGWCRVAEIYNDGVRVHCDDYGHIWVFDWKGRHIGGKTPELFWQPVDITPPPKPKLEIDWSKVPQGTPVEVRDYPDVPWRKLKFLVYSNDRLADGHFVTYTPKNKVPMSWEFCRLAPASK